MKRYHVIGYGKDLLETDDIKKARKMLEEKPAAVIIYTKKAIKEINS